MGANMARGLHAQGFVIAAVRDSHHRAAELKALVNMVMNINCAMTG
jgi:hypothetical protein